MAAVTSLSFSALSQPFERKLSFSSTRTFESIRLRCNSSSDLSAASSGFVIQCMSSTSAITETPTISETKLNFLKAYKRPIPSIYNNVLQELFVQQHLMRYKRTYRYDPVFALGFVTIYDQLMEEYPSDEDRSAIFEAYIRALNEDPEQYRKDAQKLEEWARTQTWTSLVGFSSREGEIEDILKEITARAGGNGGFSYSRFFAAGLFRLLELANASEPTILEKVLSLKCAPTKIAEFHIWHVLLRKLNHACDAIVGIPNFCRSCQLDLWPRWKSHKRLFQNGLSTIRWEAKKCSAEIYKIVSNFGKRKRHSYVPFVRLVVEVVLVMFVSVSINQGPSWSLSEENRLFLEAWRTLDRAYVDKTFNGQSWFRYRENALRNEPMNSREETYSAIRKMISTLNDPFTRFLEPEKLKNLRSGTQSSLTGVGISIGPTTFDRSSTGVVVISAAPGGPASRAGILPGDIILAIDGTSTEGMGIYEAANILQGPDGSSVELTIRSKDELKHVGLKRERVTLNPVKSRLCEMPGSAKDTPQKVGYIKLMSFTQNASDAVKEAIETLRSNDVNAFVLDLRDNSGGLFPEGIETAKIWLNKGVIVYICDSRGVRDIYDVEGSDAIAASEPLAVLVNKGTASASEILAGALKDNKRAVVFGEPTYGKGKIQSVFELSDGSGLAVTVARYETPAHTDIDKVGIKPDHPLPASFPKDENDFCTCVQDPSSACYLNGAHLFSR
ncbi:carboxyl-terminal-processing peptidase 2, chloroplastic-like isoform X1 [Chenopodium quinoa]|uniref:carboxyl-terminal-processing peptidase 2, chloroplastic-like isoform X1 n=1 Tax=Chenopodium quinoa TaxID=63459 RepID=UPI000B790315|nr:carboxyl-terminal-processing peptidase 2, chloroplastic-like isoform X1 [Chenopodium quinoa]